MGRDLVSSRALGLALSVTLCVAAGAAAQTFSDGTFNPDDWTHHVFTRGNGGTVSVGQAQSGGNPGAFRSYTNTVHEAGEVSAAIYVYHIREEAVWDPVVQGAIDSISFSEDRMTDLDYDPAMGGSIALRQAGVYFHSNTAYQITRGDWHTVAHAGLTFEDFVDPENGTQPDFTDSGAPIFFGFLRANSQDPGHDGSVTVGGTDNWSVTVAGAQVFSDSTFNPDDWTHHVFTRGNGGTVIVGQAQSGGNLGAYRSYTNTVNEADSISAIIYVYHIREDAVWDPAAQGAIDAISFSEDRMTDLEYDPAMGGSIALRQAGVYYYANTVYEITSGPWHTRAHAGLTFEDFVDPENGTQPDFTHSGAPIFFGFLRANSQDPWHDGSVTVGGTDNWFVSVLKASGIGDIPRSESLVVSYAFPNPVRGSTTISFSVPRGARAVLEVYDLAGRRVRTLFDGICGMGACQVPWHGDDDGGRKVGSGVYFHRLRTAEETTTGRVVLLH
jgi:hypothetical protein